MMTFLSAVERKRQPIVYIEARNLSFKENSIEMTLVFKNIGAKPAMTVDCILDINKSIPVGQKLEGEKLVGADKEVRIKDLDRGSPPRFVLLRQDEKEVILETSRIAPFQNQFFPIKMSPR